jgi:hypothetical protein
VMGVHGVGELNDNGARLIEFATLHIHKYTWTSPDGRTRNQIDHLLVRARDRSDLCDLRTFRGADVNTDHELLVGSVGMSQIQIFRETVASLTPGCSWVGVFSGAG